MYKICRKKCQKRHYHRLQILKLTSMYGIEVELTSESKKFNTFKFCSFIVSEDHSKVQLNVLVHQARLQRLVERVHKFHNLKNKILFVIGIKNVDEMSYRIDIHRKKKLLYFRPNEVKTIKQYFVISLVLFEPNYLKKAPKLREGVVAPVAPLGAATAVYDIILNTIYQRAAKWQSIRHNNIIMSHYIPRRVY